MMCLTDIIKPPKQAKADIVVRITADCPVIDPVLIDDVVNTLIDDEYDFVCNRLPPPWHRTYPIGLDVEACTFKVLAKAWKEAKEPQHREHAMPYFYEGVELTTVKAEQLETGISPRGFKVALLHHTTDFGDYRWTVDTPEDLEFMWQVYSRFDGRDDFSWKDVLDLVHNEPKLMEINAGVKHKTLKDIDKRAVEIMSLRARSAGVLECKRSNLLFAGYLRLPRHRFPTRLAMTE